LIRQARGLFIEPVPQPSINVLIRSLLSAQSPIRIDDSLQALTTWANVATSSDKLGPFLWIIQPVLRFGEIGARDGHRITGVDGKTPKIIFRSWSRKAGWE